MTAAPPVVATALGTSGLLAAPLGSSALEPGGPDGLFLVGAAAAALGAAALVLLLGLGLYRLLAWRVERRQDEPAATGEHGIIVQHPTRAGGQRDLSA